jgi:hypothetical protein
MIGGLVIAGYGLACAVALAFSDMFKRPAPRAPGCGHVGAVPVVSGGELVARLCPACDSQLPA